MIFGAIANFESYIRLHIFKSAYWNRKESYRNAIASKTSVANTLHNLLIRRIGALIMDNVMCTNSVWTT